MVDTQDGVDVVERLCAHVGEFLDLGCYVFDLWVSYYALVGFLVDEGSGLTWSSVNVSRNCSTRDLTAFPPFPSSVAHYPFRRQDFASSPSLCTPSLFFQASTSSRLSFSSSSSIFHTTTCARTTHISAAVSAESFVQYHLFQ